MLQDGEHLEHPSDLKITPDSKASAAGTDELDGNDQSELDSSRSMTATAEASTRLGTHHIEAGKAWESAFKGSVLGLDEMRYSTLQKQMSPADFRCRKSELEPLFVPVLYGCKLGRFLDCQKLLLCFHRILNPRAIDADLIW